MRTLLTLVLLAALAPARAAEVSCLACHAVQKTQFGESAHAQAGLTCIACHGGNAADKEPTAHGTDDFFKPADKKAIAQLCARCHSDVRKMNPYGLPTDQLERYKTSKHGEMLFGQNDQRVAVCTDCHGVHDILKSKSPQAHTYPANIPQTCGRCHSDAKLMAAYQLPADVVDQYKLSYHAQLLLEKGDLSAPTCVTCHGNHGATPPGTAEVGQVCGKCHGRQRDLFEKSPHAAAAKAGAFNECISCHGNHAIQKANSKLFAAACIQCHEGDKKPLGVRDELVVLITAAQGAYERATGAVHAATTRGLATDDEQLLLQEAKTQVTQLQALQHTLTPNEVRPSSVRAEEIAAETLRGVGQLERVEGWKRRGLFLSWGFLGLMAVLFWLKHRQLAGRRARDQA